MITAKLEGFDGRVIFSRPKKSCNVYRLCVFFRTFESTLQNFLHIQANKASFLTHRVPKAKVTPIMKVYAIRYSTDPVA